MIDALVNEAQIRWGLDPRRWRAAGGRRTAGGHPDRRVAAAHPRPATRSWRRAPRRPATRSPADSRGAASRAPRSGRRRCPGRPPTPVPGDPSRSAGSGRRRARRSSPSSWPPISPARLYLPPLEREAAFARRHPGRCPGSPIACAGPTAARGIASRRTSRCARHLLEEAYEVYDALARRLDAGPGRGARRPAAPDRPARAAGGRGGDLRPDRRARRHRRQDRAAPSARLRRRGGKDGKRRESPMGADQDGRAGGRGRRSVSGRRRPGSEAGRSDGDAPVSPRGALDGISQSMPALAASQEMQDRAAHLGYDWPYRRRCRRQVARGAGRAPDGRLGRGARRGVGDLLMVAVNLARREGVEAEAALRSANDKFRRRFRHVERLAAERGVALRDLDFDALDELWDRRQASRATLHGGDLPMTIGATVSPPRRTASGPAPPGLPHPGRPQVGRGLMPDPGRRHAGASARRRSRIASRRTFGATGPAG